MTNKLAIIERHGHVWTTSLDIAAKFHKKHKNVLQAIENLECSEQFTRLNFQPSEYKDSTGRNLKMYLMTRSGFSILAMGFTGKEAIQWKEKYIHAFDAMEQAVLRRGNEQWQLERKNGIAIRHEQTDIIKRFVDYAISQGSKSADKYYITITKMENKALFILQEGLGKPKNLRDMLSSFQISQLIIADRIVAKALNEGMENDMHYKDIYQLARGRIEEFADLVGETPVVDTSDSLIGHNNPPQIALHV